MEKQDDTILDNLGEVKTRRTRRMILGGAALLGLGIAAPQSMEAASMVVDNADWAVPALISTETAWNVGAATMLGAAGKKIGNPLTLHNRFKEVISDTGDSKLFRAGLATNMLGEIGTASVVVGGSVAYLPPTTWPLTIGASVALATPGVMVWRAIHKHRKDIVEQDPANTEGTGL